MAHIFAFKNETDTKVVFECSLCGAVVEVSKDQRDDPHVDFTDGGYVPTEPLDKFVDPCSGGV